MILPWADVSNFGTRYCLPGSVLSDRGIPGTSYPDTDRLFEAVVSSRHTMRTNAARHKPRSMFFAFKLRIDN